MNEKIYEIPVNDGFASGTECPLCFMYRKLEKDAVDFMMGPSYMEDDIRMETDEKGFCAPHMSMLLSEKNRLGLALILKTHLDRKVKEAENLSGKKISPKSVLKKKELSEVGRWAEENGKQCYLCDRIAITFPHYLDTVFYLYKKDENFRKRYGECKGFCQEHFGLLLEKAREKLSGGLFSEFCEKTFSLYIENLKRVSHDLEWFTDKFDYRNVDAPWYESKDSIERGVIKTNGLYQINKNEGGQKNGE